jgi:hypothetical protein
MNTSDLPPYKVFLSEIKRSYPEGNLEATYNRIKWFIENEQFCNDGTPITYRLIMDKFTAHIRIWNMRYGRKEKDGYLSMEAEEKRKTLFEFIGSKWYEREFAATVDSSLRDGYLFGPFPVPYLMEQLSIFKETIHGKKEKVAAAPTESP